MDPAEVGSRSLAPLDEVEGLLDLVEHGQGQNIDLGEARVRHAVLVPVHDEPTVHCTSPRGDHLRYGRTAEDHAPNVLAQHPGRVRQLGSQLDQLSPAPGIHLVPEAGKLQHLLPEVRWIVGLDLLGQELEFLLRKPQGLAEVLDDALELVGGDCPGQDGVLRPEVLMDALDQLVPETPGEVEVDIGEHGRVLGDEAFEGEVPFQGVDVADADEVSHQQRHGRAAPPSGRPLLNRRLGADHALSPP